MTLTVHAAHQRVVDSGAVTVRVRVRNTGSREGADVIQVYASPERPRARRAPHELVGFAKVQLAPGEEADVDVRGRR
ncbi:fibronectin type III-like domain-contianing protein [Phytoactinopolyspora endophytica]|uniref:fibronectin type III-like domain-contianing protein n=1 Tax=Phytoactinopolyspora endophytica TaxID=1642495 RepID=UPI0013EC8C48|nr:fibronectin type III-like domain-contianing protein [Phytoactinopolyspora endophytica]